ncbi:Flp pilus assembly protein CpaB [Caulobacter mirabilis]|uniref:Flp pilus assembly protein CpaB n=1 Tax=Caulobacter mirabilis TaxID=69666 RepID=A0A2D2B2R6_9CAUL|nr:Flp pilus assembly protein CpaB [Caulobacter mirabilis]ATQ44552.1 Flp pilus assembly protein CpaB [Caulobacter mirabilis]
MRVATIASLGASALLGVGALFVAKIWLPSTQAGPSQAAAAAPSVKLSAIVAAKAALPYGHKLEAKDLTLIHVPADAVPEGAFTEVKQVVTLDNGGPVTLTPLAAREPLLPAKLSGAGAKPSVAAVIADGMRAYTIKVNDVAGGGGHVLPGDRVDVLLTQELGDGGGSVEGSGGGRKLFVSSIVIQNVHVLGMDMVADPASTEKFPPKTATLEVTVMDAGKLAVAAEAGTLSLALRRTGASEVAQASPVRLNGGWVGAPPPRPAPAAASAEAPRRVAAPAPSQPGRGLIVTQGDQRAVVNVPADRAGW